MMLVAARASRSSNFCDEEGIFVHSACDCHVIVDENFLQERFYFKDARQSLYGLKEMTNQQAAGETASQAEFDFANVYTVPKEYEVLAT